MSTKFDEWSRNLISSLTPTEPTPQEKLQNADYEVHVIGRLNTEQIAKVSVEPGYIDASPGPGNTWIIYFSRRPNILHLNTFMFIAVYKTRSMEMLTPMEQKAISEKHRRGY